MKLLIDINHIWRDVSFYTNYTETENYQKFKKCSTRSNKLKTVESYTLFYNMKLLDINFNFSLIIFFGCSLIISNLTAGSKITPLIFILSITMMSHLLTIDPLSNTDATSSLASKFFLFLYSFAIIIIIINIVNWVEVLLSSDDFKKI